MVKCHLIKPIVVVGVDGGICSQMIAYLRGQYFAQVGIPVYYNLIWFKNCGKDVYGKFDRPFELIDAFPQIEIKQLSRFYTGFYQHFMRYKYENNTLPDRHALTRSVYLSLYPSFRSIEDFKELVAISFSKSERKNIYALDVPADTISCAVHVRRGDMDYVSFDGYDDSHQYFLDAINYVTSKCKKLNFFYFQMNQHMHVRKFYPL